MPLSPADPVPPPILLLTQGHAGDRLGAALVPALREAFPDRSILGLGGPRLRESGARLLARADTISAMGYTGLIPELPGILSALARVAAGTRQRPPGCVIAVDVWQPLHVLHRLAPHLRAAPHLCYLPPAPNLVGPARVHEAVSRAFASIVTPFPRQAELFAGGGGRVRRAAHAGLQACRSRRGPAATRRDLLALLPGSRGLEVRCGLPVQVTAAAAVRARYPALVPVVCCASEAIERRVRRDFPDLEVSRDTWEVLSAARLGLICSGTAALEAAVLGCPGVVTYHGTPLQRWEWRTFHAEKLDRLRAAGIASPFLALPNIMLGEEVYPEVIDRPAADVAAAALAVLEGADRSGLLERITASLAWEDAGHVVAEEAARLVRPGGTSATSSPVQP